MTVGDDVLAFTAGLRGNGARAGAGAFAVVFDGSGDGVSFAGGELEVGVHEPPTFVAGEEVATAGHAADCAAHGVDEVELLAFVAFDADGGGGLEGVGVDEGGALVFARGGSEPSR